LDNKVFEIIIKFVITIYKNLSVSCICLQNCGQQ